MKMASLLILMCPIIVLGFTAVAVVTRSGTSSILDPGAHGFSEILYAYTSQGNNNGSAFGGLNANTPFYNLTGALAMLVSRFWLAIPTLALAGSLARKTIVPVRYAPDSPAALCGIAGRGGDHGRCPDLRSCPGVGTGRGTFADGCSVAYRMLKTSASGVLASFRSSTYRKGTPRTFIRWGLAGRTF